MRGIPGAQVESREITLENGRKRLQGLASQLGLSAHYVESAHRLFRLALQNSFAQGRRWQAVLGSCLYIVCRRDRTAHMLLDFAEVLNINVYTLGHTFVLLSQKLNLTLPVVDPSLFIHRFASKLEFGDKTHAVAQTALKLVSSMKRDWLLTGRRPAGICAAALLLAARMNGFRRTQREIIDVVQVGDYTLRQRMYEFGATIASDLTPEEFESMEVGDEAERSDALPPSAMGKDYRKLIRRPGKSEAGSQASSIASSMPGTPSLSSSTAIMDSASDEPIPTLAPSTASSLSSQPTKGKKGRGKKGAAKAAATQEADEQQTQFPDDPSIPGAPEVIPAEQQPQLMQQILESEDVRMMEEEIRTDEINREVTASSVPGTPRTAAATLPGGLPDISASNLFGGASPRSLLRTAGAPASLFTPSKRAAAAASAPSALLSMSDEIDVDSIQSSILDSINSSRDAAASASSSSSSSASSSAPGAATKGKSALLQDLVLMPNLDQLAQLDKPAAQDDEDDEDWESATPENHVGPLISSSSSSSSSIANDGIPTLIPAEVNIPLVKIISESTKKELQTATNLLDYANISKISNPSQIKTMTDASGHIVLVEDLNDVLDSDLDAYIVTEEAEVQRREKLWTEMNADWLIKQEEKERDRLLYGGNKPKVSRKRRKNDEEEAPADSAAEAAARVLKKKTSAKVNYDVLNTLFTGVEQIAGSGDSVSVVASGGGSEFDGSDGISVSGMGSQHAGAQLYSTSFNEVGGSYGGQDDDLLVGGGVDDGYGFEQGEEAGGDDGEPNYDDYGYGEE